MKIEVFGKPMFNLQLTMPVVQALFKCSEHHYDAVCRNLSDKNGALTFMCHYVSLFQDENGVVDCPYTIDFRMADTLLKVMENPTMNLFSEKEIAALWDFRVSVMKALNRANEYSLIWKDPE